MNQYIIACIVLTLIAIVFLFMATLSTAVTEGKDWLYMKLAAIAMSLSFPFCIVGGYQADAARDLESYNAWVKHTTNPNRLSLQEWKALNRSRVPQSERPRDRVLSLQEWNAMNQKSE